MFTAPLINIDSRPKLKDLMDSVCNLHCGVVSSIDLKFLCFWLYEGQSLWFEGLRVGGFLFSVVRNQELRNIFLTILSFSDLA